MLYVNNPTAKANGNILLVKVNVFAVLYPNTINLKNLSIFNTTIK
jgi:hypothetical protein